MMLRIKVPLENVQHTDEDRVTQGIEDLISILPVDDDVFAPKNCQVLRGIGLLKPELFDQLPGRHLTVTEQLDNGDARGMSEGLKDFRFEAA